jgi:acyl-CoA hydrolase
VTEYGIADMKSQSASKRVERMIAIAHPDFRDQLRREAKAKGIIW